MEEEFEDINSPSDEVTTPEEVEVGLPKDPIEIEPIDEEVQEAEVLKQRNQELYEQLKKAKGFVRDPKDGKWIKKEALQVPKQEVKVSEDITRTELYSLVKANVPEEDTQEVILFAKSHGMSVTDALKDDRMKAVLKVNSEYRKSAEASNMGGSRKGQLKPTPEALIEQASRGELPEDINALAKARIEKKRIEMGLRN